MHHNFVVHSCYSLDLESLQRPMCWRLGFHPWYYSLGAVGSFSMKDKGRKIDHGRGSVTLKGILSLSCLSLCFLVDMKWAASFTTNSASYNLIITHEWCRQSTMDWNLWDSESKWTFPLFKLITSGICCNEGTLTQKCTIIFGWCVGLFIIVIICTSWAQHPTQALDHPHQLIFFYVLFFFSFLF